MKSQNPECPCGSGARYGACCRPFHRGEEPPDALRLMRSRYAAFALGDAAYLWRTLHPEHPDRQGPDAEAQLVAGIRRTRQTVRFARLRILDHDQPDQDHARVLFHAELFERGKERSFVELSWFELESGAWRYLSGENRAMAAADPALSRLTLASFSPPPPGSS
jgi:SEC-C motif domain protein